MIFDLCLKSELKCKKFMCRCVKAASLRDCADEVPVPQFFMHFKTFTVNTNISHKCLISISEVIAMAEKVGKRTLRMSTPVTIRASAGVAGHKEAQGPLGSDFDITYSDDRMGKSSWEKSESALQYDAATLALSKAGVDPEDVGVLLAGDLLNQCIGSTFGLRSLGIPYLGQFGACSTMAQSMLIASLLVDTGCVDSALAVTSSHFCSAERQFRLPIEYGGQRAPTAQWTVTGSGAALLDRSGCGVLIKSVTIGKICDLKICDVNNMGAAMAPAAADTISAYLHDSCASPRDFDMILTGDLGFIGSDLLIELMRNQGFDISDRHADCGKMIYDRDAQDVHAGGSGCGCCGSVLCSHIMKRLRSGELRRVLFAATGALMSPTSSQQGESIPGIAHLIEFAC